MERAVRRERWAPWVTDTVLAVVLAALSMWSLATVGSVEAGAYSSSVDGFAYVLALAQTLPLALRRKYPIAVLLVIVAGFFVDRGIDYPSTIATFGFAFAFHSVGSQLPRRRSLIIGLPVVLFLTLYTISGVAFSETVSWATVFVVALTATAPLMLGREVYEKRRYLTELEERAERLEREREAQARRAVRRERARIARELHDVVAHEMTVMTVQAAAARRVLDSQPGEAAEALLAIESAGHDALTEMRRLLGLLRTDQTAPDFAPQPGLGRLESLVGQMSEAGLDVELTVTGDPSTLPAGVDLSAYRVIQESLTNTLRHGGPSARAKVQVECDGEQLTIEVTDDGYGAAESLVVSDGAGHGIVGMRERVAMLDGEFRAGPRPGGGYRVQAVLPIGEQ